MHNTLPRIIQGGMGVGVSNWRLAKAVSRLGQLGVVSGTALDIVMARRLQEGAARETIRKELVTLRRSLKLAAERGLLRTDPNSLIPRFKAPYKPRERWLRPEEFDRLLAAWRMVSA